MASCKSCGGSGSIQYDRGTDQITATADCSECGGTGETLPNPYSESLERLLTKMTGNHGSRIDEGQRRGVRRAIAEVNRVWKEEHQ